MNWKVRFRELIGWRPKNGEKRLKKFAEIPTETLRKRLGSDFLHGTNFFPNFKWFLNYQEGWTKFLFTSPPIYRKMGEMPATQLAQASSARPGKLSSRRRARWLPPEANRLLEESSGGPKWVWLLFAPLFFLNTPPAFFWWFFFRKVT